MWAAGLVDEVRALDRAGLRDGRTARRRSATAGAGRTGRRVHRGRGARARPSGATRRFARRQRRWFRRDPRIRWLRRRRDLLDGRAGAIARPADASIPDARSSRVTARENDFVLLPDLDGSSSDLTARRVARALRPARGHRRRRRAARRPTACPEVATGRRGRVVHGLPQRRRLASPRCAATASGSSRATSSTTGLDRRRATFVDRHPGRRQARHASATDGDVSVDMGPRAVGGTVHRRGRRPRARRRRGRRRQPARGRVRRRPRSTALDLPATPGFDAERLPAAASTSSSSSSRAGPRACAMRVYERGVGETQSCGTGAVRGPPASWLAGQGKTTGSATVDVLGGRSRHDRADDVDAHRPCRARRARRARQVLVGRPRLIPGA